MQPNNPYYPPGPGAPQGMPPQGSMPQPIQPSPVPPSNQPNAKNKSLGLLITTIVLSILLLAALGFGYWAFTERQDYKENYAVKVAEEVEVAKKETTEANNIRFAEENKNPLKTYAGPGQYGSITVKYPKTWSAYIDASGKNRNAPLFAMFHPDIVPAVDPNDDDRQAIALRIEVLEDAYDSVIKEQQQRVESGEMKATAYALPKMPKETGVKFTGVITEQLSGTQIVIPIRDKTLVITSETNQYAADFEKYILPNLTFVP